MNKKDLDKKTDRLLFNLWVLNSRFNSLMFSSCQEDDCNLSIQEIKAIEFLGRVGPSKMKDLAEYLRLAVSSTTTLVDNLEAKDTVKRERSAEDRRVIILSLTEEGVEGYNDTLQAYREFCRNILTSLNETDQDIMLRIFDSIRKGFSKK